MAVTSYRSSSGSAGTVTGVFGTHNLGYGYVFSVTKPAGTANNDTLLFVLTVKDESSLGLLPGGLATFSGWSLIETATTSGGSYPSETYIYSKTAGASEPASWDFIWGDATGGSVKIHYNAYAFVAGGVSESDVTANQTGTAVTAPTLTAAGIGRNVVITAYPEAILLTTPPATYTEHVDDDSNVPSVASSISMSSFETHGPTGVQTATAASSVLAHGFSVGLTGTIDFGLATTITGVGLTSATMVNGWGLATSLVGVAHMPPGVLTVPTQPVEPDFTKYDAYLDMLGVVYYEGEGAQATTQSVPLRPVRSDIGNNPEEIRPTTGDIYAQADFSGGAGQEFFHRANRDAKSFYRSEGFDISDPGRLKHLWTTAEAVDSVNIGNIAVCNDVPWVIDGTNVKEGNGSFPGTWTNRSPHVAEGAVNVEWIAPRGAELFAALGVNGVHIKSSAGTWSHYQPDGATDLVTGTNTTRVAWLKDRLMVVGGTLSRSIYEVLVSSAPTAIETLPEGWTFEALWENGPFIYAAAVNPNAGLSRIHHYGLNAAGTAVEKKGSTAMPDGQLAYSGLGYLNSVYLGVGKRNNSGGYDPVVYQAVPSETGFLDIIKLVEEKGSGSLDLSVRAIMATGEAVLFGWSLDANGSYGADREGIAVHHLARDSFAHHLAKASPAAAPARIRDIAFYKGRILFSVSGDGLYYEDIGTYTPTAYIIPSLADFTNSGQKSWDYIEVSHKGLPAATQVLVEYGLKHPDDVTWQQAFISQLDGAEGENAHLSDIDSRLFAVRLTSTSATTVAPTILSFLVRSNPKPETPEWSLTRFIRILPEDRKDGDGEAFFQDSGAVRNQIMDMVYSGISLYEPDADWQVRIEQVGDIEPAQALHDATRGLQNKEGYILKLVMSGTRA